MRQVRSLRRSKLRRARAASKVPCSCCVEHKRGRIGVGIKRFMNLRIYEFAVSQVMSASKISRRELMSSIAVMLGMSAIRAFGFDGQRVSPRPPAPATANVRWTAEAVRRLRARQELAYADLGKRMGIGSDPTSVYRALTKGQMPAEWISPESFGKHLARRSTEGQRTTFQKLRSTTT